MLKIKFQRLTEQVLPRAVSTKSNCSYFTKIFWKCNSILKIAKMAKNHVWATQNSFDFAKTIDLRARGRTKQSK